MSDWIPRREQDVADLCHIWIETLGSAVKQQQFAWDADRCALIVSKLEDFLVKRANFHNDNNRQNRLIKDTAAAEAKALMRSFANTDIRFNPGMTEANRLLLGIRPRDTVRTGHTTVPEEVENEVRPDGIRTLAVHFKVLGAAGRAKPAGYGGAVTIWAVSDTQPETPEGYPFHKLAGRTPFRIIFDNADRGKRVWIMQSWQNERGIMGRWSAALSAFVP